MKRVFVILAMVLFLTGGLASVSAARYAVVTKEPVHTNPLLIQTAAASSTLSTANAVGSVAGSFPKWRALFVNTDEEGAALLANDPNVVKVMPEPMLYVSLAETIPIVEASSVWPIQLDGHNLTGGGQSVCIIDTGIDNDHPAFTGRIVAEACQCNASGPCCPGAVINASGPGSAADDNSHGSHVAGIIGADGVVTGVAPNVTFAIFKAFNSAGSALLMDYVAGLDWCLSQNVSTVSMSLGTQGIKFTSESTCDSWYPPGTAAIADLIGADMLPVIASGNDGYTDGLAWPGCLSNATSVGATTDGDAIASFTNRREGLLDILAPGSNVLSTNEAGGTTTKSGTSMATPHVAGAAALLQQASLLKNNVSLSPSEVFELLNSTGVGVSGWARINVFDAYNAILPIQNNSVNNSNGRINFSTTLLDKSVQRNVKIGNGFVSVDAVNEPGLDTSAVITLTGVSCPVSQIIISDGFFGNKASIQANGRACPDDVCTDIACVGSTLTFSVSGFSSFASGGNANLTINDSIEGSSIDYQLPVEYFAYYVNATSGALIQGASCNATFDDGESLSMVESAAFYSINKTYYVGGTRIWNVSCDHPQFTQLSTQDTVQIIAPVPEFSDVLWIGLLGIFVGLFVFRKNIHQVRPE